MNDNIFFKSIVEHSSVGYSFNRIIYDDNGEPKDYEFIEVNKAFVSMIGIDTKDLIGRRMSHIYEIVKKNQANWNDFYSTIVAKHKKREFEYYLNFRSKHYKINIHRPEKDYMIISLMDISKEIEFVISSADEIAENYIIKEQSEIKDRILHSSIDFTQELLTNDNLNDALSNGIDMLGNATQVDRVYYWENHYDEKSERWMTSQRLEWCLGGVEQQIDNPQLQNVPFDQALDFMGILSQNKSFSTHIKDMTGGSGSTKDVLESQGILSILVIPIFLKDEFKGFIGFDSCDFEREWSQVEISLLNSFALLYVKALEKDLLKKSIVQERENLYNFFNMIPDLLFVLDFEGNIVDINNNVLNKFNYSRKELLGETVSILHPKDKIAEVKKTMEDLIREKIEYCDIPAMTKDGHIFPVQTKISKGLWNGEEVIFAVSKDISELSISEEKFSKVFNDSGVSMFISKFDDGEIIEVNDTFLDFLGYSKEEVIGKTPLDLHMIKSYEDREKLKEEIETNKKIIDMEIEIISKDNIIRTGLSNIVLLDINNGEYLLSSIIDITDRVEYEKEILEISNRDSLTGVYNRRCVYERAEGIIEEYKRNDKLFSVAIIDIDNFKAINDKYGHQIGDCALIEFAKTISDNLRLYDILGRYGGEEFIVVLNHSNKEESNIVIERILNTVRNKVFLLNGNKIELTFCSGISSCEEIGKDEITIDKLVDIADKRMYIAKKSGKNRIVC